LESALRHFIGEYLKVYVAYSRDTKTRFFATSGGLATAILKYLLKSGHVDVVVLPKPCFKGGLAYGVWTVVRDPVEVSNYSGSLYATTFGFSRVLNYALKRFKRIAVTASPCYVKALKKVCEARNRCNDVFVIGLYCNNMPSVWATKYALKFFNIRMEDVKWVRFRGLAGPATLL